MSPIIETAELPADTAAPTPGDARADALFEAEARAVAESPLRRPRATYRLQVHKAFRLEDVCRIVDYLAELGISDCYFSPYLQARPGSTHGYDVFDHGRINAEIGGEEVHTRLVGLLRQRGMGQVLDIVPNHMGISGANRFWLEVLETGPQAPSARFFDIDWHPVKEELEGRVLLPILEDQYGKVLEAGKLALERDAAGLFVRAIGPDANRGQDGWVYKVGRRAATAGAADPSGPFGSGRLRAGQRITWYYCRLRRGGCQRTLDLDVRAGPGALVATVRGYDDEGRHVAVDGATVSAGGRSTPTDAGGVARLPLTAGRYRVVAEKAGMIRSFAERVEVP
jgi:hypothetical protein